MREIKFRAKRQDNGEWIRSGTLVSFHSGDTTDFFLPKSPSHCDAWADQDAEGNDIYEGDIVQHGEKLYVIRYIDHYARFVGKNKGSIFAVFPFGNCTIMGNIYDHANLMEAGKCS